MITINSDFNNAVNDEEKKLLDSYTVRKKILDVEKQIRDARKDANKALNAGDKQAYELARANMEKLEKARETMKENAHKLAIKRAADLRRKEEDDLRALQKRRSESEKLSSPYSSILSVTNIVFINSTFLFIFSPLPWRLYASQGRNRERFVG